jgi:hypothetical protein
MDCPDQARRKQRVRRGASECIILAFVLVGVAATTILNLTCAASAQSLLLLPVASEPIQTVERAVPIGPGSGSVRSSPRNVRLIARNPRKFRSLRQCGPRSSESTSTSTRSFWGDGPGPLGCGGSVGLS